MKDILDKISSYNLFNYLLPGVVFAYSVNNLTPYQILSGDVIVDAFIAYFIGLIVSRFGSLVVEPLLKKTTFLEYVDYQSYVSASKKDPKLELLSEVNNSYRTLSSMFILIALLKMWVILEAKISFLRVVGPYFLLVLILVMFLFSYKKQTEYVVKRVKANK